MHNKLEVPCGSCHPKSGEDRRCGGCGAPIAVVEVCQLVCHTREFGHVAMQGPVQPLQQLSAVLRRGLRRLRVREIQVGVPHQSLNVLDQALRLLLLPLQSLFLSRSGSVARLRLPKQRQIGLQRRQVGVHPILDRGELGLLQAGGVPGGEGGQPSRGCRRWRRRPRHNLLHGPRAARGSLQVPCSQLLFQTRQAEGAHGMHRVLHTGVVGLHPH
mmetsp:Transcript_58635/g.104628  ORF Transcript_58635/g.104628 Transcript_58635/m.104628 type:complete len:215 (-) Transcript_58635:378-1022(-)